MSKKCLAQGLATYVAGTWMLTSVIFGLMADVSTGRV